MSLRSVLLSEAPWHNGNNLFVSGQDLENLMKIKTRPTGETLKAYQRAFVHSSYVLEGDRINPSRLCDAIIPLQKESNERLEFLGDAVIDLIVAEYLYERYPDEDEGFLTEMRIGLVNGKMLASLGRTLCLQKHLLMSFQSENLRESDNVVEDTLEAFVGAIYMIRGMKAAKQWFIALIEENVDFTQLVTTSERDMFLRLYRERFGRDVEISMTRAAGDMGDFTCVMSFDGQVLGTGTGKTRRIATDMAARMGLQADDVGQVMVSLVDNNNNNRYNR